MYTLLNKWHFINLPCFFYWAFPNNTMCLNICSMYTLLNKWHSSLIYHVSFIEPFLVCCNCRSHWMVHSLDWYAVHAPLHRHSPGYLLCNASLFLDHICRRTSHGNNCFDIMLYSGILWVCVMNLTKPHYPMNPLPPEGKFSGQFTQFIR